MENKNEELINITDELTARFIEHLRLNYYNVKYNIEGIDLSNIVNKSLIEVVGKSKINFVICESCGRVYCKVKSQ